MAKSTSDRAGLPVTFVGLEDGKTAPQFAAYQVDAAGQPLKKVGGFDGKVLQFDDAINVIAFGPDVENFKTLPKNALVTYRVPQMLDVWRKQGVVLARDIWDRFHPSFTCVSGTVSKCRPWFWDFLGDVLSAPMFELAQTARIKPINADLNPHIHFPFSCQPLCDAIVEIYARECCCHHVHIPDLLGRLRDILDVLPIPIPDLIPEPIPGPDPAPFMPRLPRAKARAIQRSKVPVDLTAAPPETLYLDYLSLRALPVDAAQNYVLARPYLFPIFCHCSVRKVGETMLQPGGHFSFCYLNWPGYFHSHHHCTTTYAYKIKQRINGVWTVVYDGLSAHQYFSGGEPANVHVYNPQARTCADGPGDPPPNDGLPFVMLEHVGAHGTFHFNFPNQTGVSHMSGLNPSHGTYTTSYAPDCPWGGGLGLRLWFSPELESVVQYYRLKVVRVDDNGHAVGTPIVLDDTVTWDKFVDIPGDIVRAPEVLGPMPVGAESNLFKVPYWSSPDHRYLSGQFHQVWNTDRSVFSDGKYMLILEVFDGAGNRIKPNGATGPGTARNFQFRRWASSADTDPVPYADLAHVMWIDNTPVGGDIVDLRLNHVANTAECQFLTGTGTSRFSIGLRAYHVHGVEHAGNGDDNSFMWKYGISWQRGLNGPTGTLGFAPSGGTNHTDVGETGDAVESGDATFQSLLGSQPKCTFSVTLHVAAKHFNGGSRVSSYDYWETASFALESA